MKTSRMALCEIAAVFALCSAVRAAEIESDLRRREPEVDGPSQKSTGLAQDQPKIAPYGPFGRPRAHNSRPAIIVRARVATTTETQARYHGETHVSTVDIIEVFVGGDRWLDHSFRAFSADRIIQGTSSRTPVFPKLIVGEEGLWLLESTDGALKDEHGSRTYCDVEWPARRTAARRDLRPARRPEYSEVESLVRTIKALDECPTIGDKLALLKKVAATGTSLLGTWAVCELRDVAMNDEKTRRFLEQLPYKATASFGAKIEVDRVMMEFDEHEWQRADERLQLYREWVTGKLSKGDARLLTHKLSQLAQHPNEIGFPQGEFVGLMRKWVNNGQAPMESRENVVRIASWVSRRYETDEEGFAFLMECLKDHPSVEGRINAAQVLKQDFHLDDDRRERLKRLRKSVADERLAKLLEALTSDAPGTPAKE